jgi:hypothetical protein
MPPTASLFLLKYLQNVFVCEIIIQLRNSDLKSPLIPALSPVGRGEACLREAASAKAGAWNLEFPSFIHIEFGGLQSRKEYRPQSFQ